MSRTLVNPISSLFDVACRHHTVQVSCACGNVGIFDPHALWWLFERKGWNDKLPAVRKRLDLYAAETLPLVGLYQDRGLLCEVDGLGSPDDVFARLLAAVSAHTRD